MSNLGSMLGAATTWKQLAESVDWAKGWVGPFLDALSNVLWVALAIAGAAGAIYAIYVGIKMAQADSAEKREENKKRLINIVITIVSVLILIVIFNVVLPVIISSIPAFGAPDVDGSAGGTSLIRF